MKALRFERYGPPSALTVIDMAEPRPKEGYAVVKIASAGINPSDVKNVAGAFNAALPRIPGRDFAGTVIEGGGAQWDGRAVWGSGADFGVAIDGAHAEYVSVPLSWLSEKPAGLTMAQAACVGVPYLVAWAALAETAALQAGETVLITGAAGAVGRAATQIARWRGAVAIGADRANRHTQADISIDISRTALAEETRRLTDGRGADVVLDVVGGAVFEDALNALARGGRQIAIASAGNSRVTFDLVHFYHEQKRLIGVDSMKSSGEEIAEKLNHLRPGFESGDLDPGGPHVWPLEDAAKAYESVEAGASVRQVFVPPTTP